MKNVNQVGQQTGTRGGPKGPQTAHGQWKNVSVTLVESKDEDDEYFQRLQRTIDKGLDPTQQQTRKRLIDAHRRTPAPPPPTARELRASIPPGSEVRVRQMARDFIRTGRLPRHGEHLDRDEATLQYLALRTVEVALRDSDDNKNPHHFLAQLLPLHHDHKGGRQPLSPRGIGRQLRGVRGDRHALKSLLGPIYGDEELPDELFDLLDDGETRDNDDALVELLAEAYELPKLGKRRARLDEQLDDAREDLLHSNRQSIFGSLNAEQASRKTDDPKAFKDNYCELVHRELGFAGTFKKVVELFGSENLRSTLNALKNALGDDMEALSAPSSYSPEQLTAIHNVVSHLSKLSQINVVLDTALPLLKLSTESGTPLDEPLLTAGISTLFDAGTPTALRFQVLCEELRLARGGPRIKLLNQLGTIIRTLPADSFADPAGSEDPETRRSLFMAAMLAAQEDEQRFDDPELRNPLDQREEEALALLSGRAQGPLPGLRPLVPLPGPRQVAVY